MAAPSSPVDLAELVRARTEFLGFLERRVGNRADAEDLLQSALLKAAGRPEALRDAASLKAWFYRILRNLMADRWRQGQAEQRALALASAGEPDLAAPADPLFGEVCACVDGLLEGLKPEYRSALRQVYLEDGSPAALAVKEGITRNSATVRLHRARRALRRALEAACRACAAHGCLDCRCRGNRV